MRPFLLCLIVLTQLVACAPSTTSAGTLRAEKLRLEPHFSGLTQPTDLRFLDDGRALATEQRGRVVLLGAGELQTVLDLQAQTGCCFERGLLSLALHPDFGKTACSIFMAATGLATPCSAA